MLETRLPNAKEVREPLRVDNRYFVELFSYGQINPFGHSLMAAKEHFKDRSDLSVLEIGVLRGHNAENIYRELHPKILVLVDSWELSQISLEYHDCNWAETYYRVQGKENIIVIKASSVCASKILNLMFDYIYIDGDHGNIQPDLDCWWPRMNEGGIFSGHDYNYDNIKKSVDDFFGVLSLEIHSSPYHPDGGMDWWIFT